MTLKQLELFLAVADQRSFSRGAEAVSLVQSTASQHIRSMEEELEIRLFDRSKNGAQLTEAGRLFAEHARRVCDAYRDALLAMRRFHGVEEAIVRVGASTIPAVCLIPDLLGRMSASHPGIRLELVQGDTREVVRLLQADLVELAVVGGRFEGDAIDYQPLVDEQIVLVARAGVHHPERLPVQELVNLPLIMREYGSGTRQVVDAELLNLGVDLQRLHVVAQLGSSEAIRRAVLSGAGYGFVSSLAVERELADGSLTVVTIEGLDIRQQFYLARKRSRTISPAAELFAGLLCTAREGFGTEEVC